MRCSSVVVTLFGMILPSIWRDFGLYGKIIYMPLITLLFYLA